MSTQSTVGAAAWGSLHRVAGADEPVVSEIAVLDETTGEPVASDLRLISTAVFEEQT